MKHIIYILTALMLFVSCRTARTVTQSYEANLQQRDSVMLRDSVSIRYVTATRNSVVIRDSVVIVKDASGKVIGTERYRTSDRVRDRSTDTVTTAKNTEARDNVRKEQVKTAKMDSKSVRFSMVNTLRAAGWLFIASIILYLIYKMRRLWKWW